MLTIVTGNGEVALYRGKRLEFLDSERARAEMVLSLVRSEAANANDGPFNLREDIDRERDEHGAYRVFPIR